MSHMTALKAVLIVEYENPEELRRLAVPRAISIVHKIW